MHKYILSLHKYNITTDLDLRKSNLAQGPHLVFHVGSPEGLPESQG